MTHAPEKPDQSTHWRNRTKGPRERGSRDVGTRPSKQVRNAEVGCTSLRVDEVEGFALHLEDARDIAPLAVRDPATASPPPQLLDDDVFGGHHPQALTGDCRHLVGPIELLSRFLRDPAWLGEDVVGDIQRVEELVPLRRRLAQKAMGAVGRAPSGVGEVGLSEFNSSMARCRHY